MLGCSYNNFMNEYELYLQKIAELKNFGLEPQIYGRTVFNHPLHYYRLTKRVNYNERPIKILVQAGIHAREHITTFLVFRLIEHYYVQVYRELSKMNYSHNPFLKLNYELYFVPNSNVDGLRLCAEGVDFISDELCSVAIKHLDCDTFCDIRKSSGKNLAKIIKNRLIELNLGNRDFSLWKANANGVDLNVNFDAHFGKGVKNSLVCGAENYIGRGANSEPETRALVGLVNKIKPNLTISYHCKGQEIYYQFHQDEKTFLRDKKIAEIIERTTKYKIVDVSALSAGGFKDYCIEKLKIPAFTIEVGDDALAHPIGAQNLTRIYKENKNVIRNILRHFVV